jgi:protein SCO1/2
MRYLAVLLIGACILIQVDCGPAGNAGQVADYRGSLLIQPIPKADFTLTDTDGQPFRFREATDGHVTLVFFGYTHCPDVCPIHMANIAAVLQDFPFELRQQFKVVFVTTDPARDTPERLREWLDNFDRSFIGLYGARDEVNVIQQALGLPASIIEETGDGDYLVGHSARVLAFTKDDLAHVAYPFGTRQSDWAHDLPKLAREIWGST